MADPILNKLVDVIALSKHQCQYPLMGQLAYATPHNFIGRIIDGYSPDAAEVCLMTRQAALALCQVQNHLANRGLGLFIYDAYRPLRAVQDFAQWLSVPNTSASEEVRKAIHYPHLEKADLTRGGYIADTVSRHNFGYAVDLSLIELDTHKHLDMGACFDFFDDVSHTTVGEDRIGATALQHRVLLSEAMQKFQFIPYQFEFWHFDYAIHEVETPIDIPIVSSLKQLNQFCGQPSETS